MSEYEHIEGVIEKIPRLDEENIDDYFERATGCKCENKDWYDSLSDMIWDNNLNRRFIVLNDEIYQFLRYQEIDNFDYCEITQLKEDRYQFSTCFYNGGACLSEVLEDELKAKRFVFKAGGTCQEQ